MHHVVPEPGWLAACRAERHHALEQDVQTVMIRLTAGKAAEAQSALTALDTRYGGLAAERSLDLAARLTHAP